MVRLVKQSPTLAFILAAYAISWGVWLPMAFMEINFSTQVGWLLYLVGSFGPSLAGLLLMGVLYGTSGPSQLISGIWRKPMRLSWLVTAIILPFLIIMAALSVQILLGGAAPDFGDLYRLGLIIIATFVRIFFIGGPLGEELGWRGFALPRLQMHQSALRASVLLGLVWGIWHIPIYFIPGTGQYEMAQDGQILFSFGSFLIWIIALSILLTWLYNNSTGSILVVLLFHAAVNVSANLPVLLNAPGLALMLNGAFTWVAALIVILVAGGSRLSRVTEVDVVSQDKPVVHP